MTLRSRTFASAALITALLALSACNTVAGIGKDIESAGRGVQKTSNEVRS